MKVKAGVLVVLILMGCGKKNQPSPNNGGKAVSLISPKQNEVCANGVVISDQKSAIAFSWSNVGAGSYDFHVKNLLTNKEVVKTVNATSVNDTLLRGTPYLWYVVSNFLGGASQTSDLWRFYNSGLSVTTYLPFPAQLLTPTLGQKVVSYGGITELSWKGSSVNNNIANYDLYFGSSLFPPLFKSNINVPYCSVPITAGTSYCWKIVTRDTDGNTSESETYQFSVYP